MSLYRVLGYDRINNDYYELGYTANKSKCERHHKRNGWKKEDLIFLKRGVSK